MGGRDISGIPKTEQKSPTIKPNKKQRSRILAQALSLFISNSLFLALNGALVVVFASLLYGCFSAIKHELLLAAFLITFSVYCLNNVTDTKEDAINRPRRLSKKRMHYIVASATAMTISIVLGLLNGLLSLLIISLPLLIGLIYSIPVTKSVPRLKEIVGVKSLAVAFSWASTGALLPLTLQSIDPSAAGLVFIYIFVSIFVNTVAFDALDMKGDFISGVKTIPIVLGRKNCRILLLLINSSLVIWMIYCIVNGLFGTLLFAIAFGIGYEYLIILHFFRTTAKRLHAELTVDGVWLPIVVLMRLILH